MVLNKLGSSLKDSLQKIAKSIFVDEKLVNELVKDIQKALLQADVNVKLVFELTNTIKKRVLKEKIPAGITKKEYLVKVVYEELTNFLGGEVEKIEIKKKPFRIMLVGLFGNGKTTTAGKLAKYYSKRGHTIAIIGLDVHRPAAMIQVEQIAKAAKVSYFIDKEEKDPVKIIKKHEKEFNKFDILIFDTAGRDALSDDLIEELNKVNNYLKADENLLVIGADIGQAAETQAKAFHESCGVTGVIITKLDGTAKGGGSLSACAVTNANVKFIGVGEKLSDIELFKPENFVSRLLGMGDLETLLEKAREAVSEKDAEDMSKKFAKGKFNLIDLHQQLESMSKMGPLNKLIDMIPGFGQVKIPKDMLNVQEGKLKKWKIIMGSMTKKELEDPEIVIASRAERIAKGSGCSISEVRELLKQFKQSKKMMKMLSGSKQGMNKMMKKFQQGKVKYK